MARRTRSRSTHAQRWGSPRLADTVPDIPTYHLVHAVDGVRVHSASGIPTDSDFTPPPPQHPEGMPTRVLYRALLDSLNGPTFVQGLGLDI